MRGGLREEDRVSTNERTLIIVKPDAVHRGLIGRVLGRLEDRGLRVVALKMIWVDDSLAREHYQALSGKDFFEDLVAYITSSPVVVGVVEGSRAVKLVRETVGKTDPLAALPGTIRADFGLSIGRNIIHASDDEPGSAEREVSLFFSDSEIMSYERAIDPWIVEG
jgi:nucleoside-diphosphate kinase